MLSVAWFLGVTLLQEKKGAGTVDRLFNRGRANEKEENIVAIAMNIVLKNRFWQGLEI